MKCSCCGEDIDIFRVVGLCDCNNFVADEIKDSSSNIPLLVRSNFIAVAMLTCTCGDVRFITVKKALEGGLRQDGHARAEMSVPAIKGEGYGH